VVRYQRHEDLVADGARLSDRVHALMRAYSRRRMPMMPPALNASRICRPSHDDVEGIGELAETPRKIVMTLESSRQNLELKPCMDRPRLVESTPSHAAETVDV